MTIFYEVVWGIKIDCRPKMKFSTKFFKNEDGATAIGYGLIAALIAVAAITAMTSLGENLSGTFTNVGDKLETANTAS